MTRSVARQVLPPQSSSGYPMEKPHVGNAVGCTTPISDFDSVGRRSNCSQKLTTPPYPIRRVNPSQTRSRHHPSLTPTIFLHYIMTMHGPPMGRLQKWIYLAIDLAGQETGQYGNNHNKVKGSSRYPVDSRTRLLHSSLDDKSPKLPIELRSRIEGGSVTLYGFSTMKLWSRGHRF